MGFTNINKCRKLEDEKNLTCLSLLKQGLPVKSSDQFRNFLQLHRPISLSEFQQKVTCQNTNYGWLFGNPVLRSAAGLSYRLAGTQSFPLSHSLHPGPRTHLTSSLWCILLELNPAFLIWKRIGNFLTKIAPTQQGAVTEQSLALQLEALKEETTPVLHMLQWIQAMLWGKN